MKAASRFACTLLLAASLAGLGTSARGAEKSVPVSGKSGKRTRPAATDEAMRGRPRVAPRMLDDIRIEGEIPVPQVLFITARDQRRFMEFQHHRYPVTSLELGRATPAPSRLVVTTSSPDKAKQGDPR